MKLWKTLPTLRSWQGLYKKNITPINVAGVSDSVRAHLAFCVSEKFQAPILLVAENEAAAMEIADDLRFFSGAEVLYYGNSDILFLRCRCKEP